MLFRSVCCLIYSELAQSEIDALSSISGVTARTANKARSAASKSEEQSVKSSPTTARNKIPSYDFTSQAVGLLSYSWFRPSHTTTETAKQVVIVRAHYNFFSQLRRFFQQCLLYIDKDFYKDFFRKIFVKIFVVCEGL